jgi:hypothetical protein
MGSRSLSVVRSRDTLIIGMNHMTSRSIRTRSIRTTNRSIKRSMAVIISGLPRHRRAICLI